MSQAVILFARAPSAAGKTRLTADLPPDSARSLREALLLDTLDAVRTSGVAITVFYDPAGAGDELRALIPDLPLRPQRGDTLGERMQRAIDGLMDAGAQSVVLIGSDLPALPPPRVAEAFAALARGAECVLGPSPDGGYYLIGLAASASPRHVALFDDIAWGTSSVFEQTLLAARGAGFEPIILLEHADVDRAEDLAELASSAHAGRTSFWVQAHQYSFELHKK